MSNSSARSKASGSRFAAERADHQHRAGGELDVPVLDRLAQHPRREGRDRLVAQRLLRRPGSHPLRVLAQRRPLVRSLGEEAERVGELALRGVHPADEHVEHEVLQLHPGEPVALLLGRDQRRDQVVGGRAAPPLDQRPDPGVELGDLVVDRGELGLVGERDRVELALDPHRPVVQAVGVLGRGAHHRRDHAGRVGPGDGLDQVAAPGRGDVLPELGEDLAHRRAPAVGRAGRERRVEQAPQAAVVGAVDVDDVVDDLLVEGALGDREELGQEDARGRSRPCCGGRTPRPRGRGRRSPAARWASHFPEAARSAIAPCQRSPLSAGSVRSISGRSRSLSCSIGPSSHARAAEALA